MNEITFYNAVDMAKAGRKAEARTLLYRVLTANHGSEMAWLWYAECASSTEQRIQDLEFALRLHPNMHRVRAGLRAIRRGKHFDPARTQPVFIGKTSIRPPLVDLPGTQAALPDEDADQAAGAGVFTVPPEQVSEEEFQAIQSRAEALLLDRPLMRQERREDPWQSLTAIPVTSSPPPSAAGGPPPLTLTTLAALVVMLGFVLLVSLIMLL